MIICLLGVLQARHFPVLCLLLLPGWGAGMIAFFLAMERGRIRLPYASLLAATFGVLMAWIGLDLDHEAINFPNYADTWEYENSALCLGLTLGEFPGEMAATLVSQRDWLVDEAWTTYRYSITAWNAGIYFGAIWTIALARGQWSRFRQKRRPGFARRPLSP